MRLKTRLATLRDSARALWQDTGGQSLMIFGLMAVPLCGAVGIGLDVAQWTVWKRQLHSAADAAALAGATAKIEGKNVKAAVNKALAQNTQRAYTVVAIEDGPTSGAYSGDTKAVRVILRTSQKLSFSSMFMKQTPAMDVAATAIGATEVGNCVIALDTTGTPLQIGASSSVDFDCGMASNNDLDALSSDMIRAKALSAAGNVNVGSQVTPETRINPGAGQAADPLAGKLTMPAVPGGCVDDLSVRSNKTVAISPGCWASMDVKGNLTMAPGTYIINGGDIRINAKARITGIGVTIIMTNSSTSPSAPIGGFKANGNSIVQLKAPTTGTWAGILFWRDSRASVSNPMVLTGTSGTETGGGVLRSTYEGAVYSPSSAVEFTGNSSVDTPCMQLVARRVKFWGNSTVINKCPGGASGANFADTIKLKLVE
ncbi:pilus assembly protein TadG-related protein [Alteriqipengyuania flavescens]|uniref:pilus assembly protein TadG-related protein n=1 Tax=Alteriqipengyuania flavescens TaxID=3053610 RepID=UPI0025B2E676|nr:pilus assembly protein TadG-related protein [Alteriqipengyuania flavescens]WJY19802.1 pilus assembly protein TadG-related protein [Alteriqipengyuania flavescens]WJY25744.1 pilus assembly protein TadG-related protein [Alteriqipengyuania flavescens]